MTLVAAITLAAAGVAGLSAWRVMALLTRERRDEQARRMAQALVRARRVAEEMAERPSCEPPRSSKWEWAAVQADVEDTLAFIPRWLPGEIGVQVDRIRHADPQRSPETVIAATNGALTALARSRGSSMTRHPGLSAVAAPVIRWEVADPEADRLARGLSPAAAWTRGPEPEPDSGRTQPTA